MIVLLAVYSTPQTGSPGFRWLWSDGALTDGVLANCLQKLQQYIPADVLALGDGVAAGMFALDDRVVIFRIHDGGRDARGRPGRLFIAVAVADRHSIAGKDLTAALEHPVITDVHDERPNQTSFTITTVSAEPDVGWIKTVANTGLIQFTSNDAISNAFTLIGGMPVSVEFELKISNLSRMPTASLTVANTAPLKKILARPRPQETLAEGRSDNHGRPPPSRYRLSTVLIVLIIGFIIGIPAGLFIGRAMPWWRNSEPGSPPSSAEGGFKKHPVGGDIKPVRKAP